MENIYELEVDIIDVGITTLKFKDKIPNINESIIIDKSIYTVNNIIYEKYTDGCYKATRLVLKKGI